MISKFRSNLPFAARPGLTSQGVFSLTYAPFRYLDRPLADCSRQKIAELVADASPALASLGLEVAMRELAAFCDVRRDPLPGAVIVDCKQRTVVVVGRFGQTLRVRSGSSAITTLLLTDWLELAHDATVLSDPFAAVAWPDDGCAGTGCDCVSPH